MVMHTAAAKVHDIELLIGVIYWLTDNSQQLIFKIIYELKSAEFLHFSRIPVTPWSVLYIKKTSISKYRYQAPINLWSTYCLSSPPSVIFI